MDTDKSHKVLIRKEKLKDKVVKPVPKTKESRKLRKPISDYSALLVNEMRKHPGTKASGLDDGFCFFSYKAWLNSKKGEEFGIRILLSETVKVEKKAYFRKKGRNNICEKDMTNTVLHYSKAFISSIFTP